MLPCPVCRRNKSLSRDNEQRLIYEQTLEVALAPEGGHWWYCHSCQRGWDSLELIAEMNHDGDIRSAIAEVLRDPDSRFPDHMQASGAVEEYIAKIIIPRRKATSWSELARRKWSSQKDLYALLARKLNVGVRLMETMSAAMTGVGRWIHATSKFDLSETLNQEARLKLPEANFKSCLALPWSSSRGKLSALLLIGWHDDVRMWYPGFVADTKGDPGIMLMDALPAFPKRVIAVSSPYMALWLQYKQFQEDNRPAPVVAWHSDTSPEVWRRIGAQEVVFWDYVLSPEMLYQALNTANSQVSYADSLSFTMERQLGTIEAASTWSQLHTTMVGRQLPAAVRIEDLTIRMRDPWDACRDYLLSLPLEQVGSALDILKLQSTQIDRLINGSRTADERLTLERVLQYTRPERYGEMHGGTVRQLVSATESLLAFKKGKRNEVISDAVLQLDRAIYDTDNENTLYTGTIHFRGKQYPLTTSYSEIRNDTARLITKTLERAGAGTPRIMSLHNRLLADAVFFFSSIERTEQAITRVGWDKDLGFQFPRFTIKGGRLENRQCYGLDDYRYPARTVNMPPAMSNELLEPWLQDTPACAAAWAVMTTLLDNALCRASGHDTRGTALLGTLAKTAAAKLASDLDLVTFNPDKLKSNFVDFLRAQNQHDLPVYIDADPVSMPQTAVTWMSSSEPKNAFMQMTPTCVTAALLCGGWVLIDTEDALGEFVADHSMADVLVHLIGWLQLRPTMNAVNYSTSIKQLLNEITEWATLVSDKDCRPLFAQTRRYIRNLERQANSRRVVHMVIHLLREGYLKRDYGTEVKPRGAPVVFDRENRRVYVEKARFAEAMRRRGLASPDTDKITDQLRMDGLLLGEVGVERSVWAITEEAWELAAEQWYKQYAVHK